MGWVARESACYALCRSRSARSMEGRQSVYIHKFLMLYLSCPNPSPISERFAGSTIQTLHYPAINCGNGLISSQIGIVQDSRVRPRVGLFRDETCSMERHAD